MAYSGFGWEEFFRWRWFDSDLCRDRRVIRWKVHIELSVIGIVTLLLFGTFVIYIKATLCNYH